MAPGVTDLALFALTVFILNATPGPDMALTLIATLRGGVKAGLAAASGICAGCTVHALGAAFGVAALMAASATAFTIVKWVGAAYLAWLAIGMLRTGLSLATTSDEQAAPIAAPAGAWALWRQGFFTNVLNPKVALFFLALLPQFIAADAPDKTAAFLFLGAWFIVQGFLFLGMFVMLVAPLRRWQPGPGVRRGLHLAGGGLFALLAARLALFGTGPAQMNLSS